MSAELGQWALLLALGVACLQVVLPSWCLWRQQAHGWAVARRLAWTQLALVAFAFAALVWAFVQHDFSVAYVVQHSNTRLPWHYRVAGAWGGHEGSLLLWLLMLTAWGAAVATRGPTMPEPTRARVLVVLAALAIGFLDFTLLTSNPFARQWPPAPDGRDLNPLLQDLGMIVHPPLLYMGYVGFAVVFACAMAALWEGRLDASWAKWSRPWALWAWAFLTLGIWLGSFWAYYELGWGGWWFWDAVENASLMPWLVGAALLHSLAVTEKRGSFKNWTVLLAILAFSLSLLGTFLVRSGVLTSVHAFASDPQRGFYILGFLVCVVGGALALYASRAAQVGVGKGFAPWSRATLLLLNNLFLLALTGSVLLGTLYPLVIDALGLGKISVGPPYFDTVFWPLGWGLLLLLGLGPWLAWKNNALSVLAGLRWPAAIGVGLSGLVWVCTSASPLAIGAIGLAGWVAASTTAHAWQGLRGPDGRWRSVTRSVWGMWFGHWGVAVFVLGVSLANGFGHSQDAVLSPGQSVSVAGHEFVFQALGRRQASNYHATWARFDVRQVGAHVAELVPERRFYTVQRMPMTEAAIDRGWTRDLYVSLGEANPSGGWNVKVQIKPGMTWIWAGCWLMAAGGLLAATDRRYRAPARLRNHEGEPV